MEKLQNNIGFIHSIESFGTVDGPGIRFVVFVQGCPMRCKYCHNPDTWNFIKDESKKMKIDEILSQYDSCSDFYKNGGLTVTGGEPLGQIEFVTELFRVAHEKKHIHTALDTSGILFDANYLNSENTSLAKFDELIKYTNLVLLDIKHIDEKKHIELTGHSNENVLAFARYLSEKKIPTIIRHVLVPSITDDEESLSKLAEFIDTLDNIIGIDILPYHTMAKEKYARLGIEYPLEGIRKATSEDVQRAKKIILEKIHL